MELNGQLTVIENDGITVTCDYADLWPIGNQSSFHFREVPVVQNKVRLVGVSWICIIGLLQGFYCKKVVMHVIV